LVPLTTNVEPPTQIFAPAQVTFHERFIDDLRMPDEHWGGEAR
jgi:hypothetical protein